MKHLIALVIMLTFFSLSASNDSSHFAHEIIDGKTFSGAFGKSYAEIGKRMPLFDFYFIGIRFDDGGFEICLKPNQDMEYACYWSHDSRLLRFSKNFCVIYESPIGEYWYNEAIKITQLYYFIKDLEENQEKKHTFLDFHTGYFIDAMHNDNDLENFINLFEPDIFKKQFLWKIHQKSFNELSMQLDCRELTRKIDKLVDNKIP